MFNILFISNDSRVNGLISYLQPLLKGTINCTADFDHGLKDVFDKRPAIVFIQRKIAGVSGDVVAQHIKGLLRDSRPKIILLQDEGENIAMNSCYDDTIGFVVQEPEIYRLFYNYLRKFPEIQWIETHHGETAGAVAGESNEKTFGLSPDDDRSSKPVPAPGQLPSRDKAHSPKIESPPLSQGQPKRSQPAGKTAQFAALPRSGKSAKEENSVPPLEFDFFKRPWWRRPAVLAPGVGLILIVFVLAFSAPRFLGSYGTISAKPDSKTRKAVVTGTAVHLPSVIIANLPDPAFAAANPGWQSYRGERMEFRVFLEKGAVAVIQAICLEDTVIGNEFLHAFLLDLVRSSDYRIITSQRKDGYLIEKGKLADNAEIIVYRQEKTNSIKGFVISFS